MASLGDNITAVSVRGTFDDCQRLVKQAFADDELRKQVWLTPANSINLGRLLPQVFYYFVLARLAGDADRFGAEREFRQPDGRPHRQADRAPGPPFRGRDQRQRRRARVSALRTFTSRVRRCGRWPMPWTSARRATSSACARSTTTTSIACGRTSKARRSRTPGSSRRLAASTGSAAICSIRTAPSRGSGCSRRSRPIQRRRACFWPRRIPAKFREVVEPAIGQPVALPATLAAALARPRHSVPLPASYPELVDLVLQTV